MIPQRAERYSCLERRNGCMPVVEPAAAINEENHDFLLGFLCEVWPMEHTICTYDKSSFFPIRIHGFLPEHVR
jgi:hypothetical protein